MSENNYIEGLVSVVIPTYKRFDTLSRAIRSVQYQTYKPIEILVVDDNDPGDEYSKGVRSLIQEMDLPNLIMVTQEKHINGAAARNAGISQARGEYIAFLDDDDMWLPQKIEKTLEFLKKQPNEVGAVSDRKVFVKDGKIDHVSEKWKADKNQNFKVISKQQNIQTCTLLIRRDYLDSAGYFDPSLRRHQEVQLMAFFTDKYIVKFLDEILTVIDSSDVMNRPSSQKIKEFKEDYFRSIEKITDKYSKHRRKLIYAHNMTEVAYAIYRDGNKRKGLVLLIGCLKYPSVLSAFFKRYMQKKTGKRLRKCISDDFANIIYGHIRQCEE